MSVYVDRRRGALVVYSDSARYCPCKACRSWSDEPCERWVEQERKRVEDQRRTQAEHAGGQDGQR